MGFESIDQSGQHQMLNVIQKQAFHVFGWRGVVDGVQVNRAAQPIIRSWTQSKNEHFIFLGKEGWWMGFESINQPSQSSEVEHNPKMSIPFFWLERGGRWGLSSSTSPANHQKLNKIQKWGFHFLTEEGWRMGFESINQPGQSSEVERNPKTSISFYWLEMGGGWGSSPSTSLADYQKWTQSKKKHFILLAGEAWQMGFKFINQPGRSSEVNVI